MGDGVKWPEESRPSFKSISEALDARVSRKLQNLFLQDIQNDCDCNTEVYDSDDLREAFFITKDGISKAQQDKVYVPMLDDICEKDILNLLEEVCKSAGNGWGDITFNAMLYNPAQDTLQLKDVFEKYIHPVIVFRDGTLRGWIPLDFIPLGTAYLIPDAEWFGAITANIGKFGAFCFPNNVIKVEL